jgi:alpha-L-arabinofuranosidase
MRNYGKFLTASAVAMCVGLGASAAHNELTLQTNKLGAQIQPTMYGLFFEDINFAADGGLYAEMVKNRSFEFPQSLQGWVTYGNVEVRNDGPFERNPHYVRVSAASHAHKHSGLENEGFFGVAVKEGEEYRFSVWARVPEGDVAKLKIVIADTKSQAESQNIATAHITVDSKEWKKYTVILKSKVTEPKGKLRIFLERPEATVDLEHISLFPVDTWKGHENGLRRDLAQKLADLHPGVFRFPGGCIVEGTEIEDRYQWKNTVGDVENRPTNANRWHYTFTNRFYPDYYQSGGLGFYEYFLLSEEIGAAPLPVLNVGLVCQYQNDKPEAHVPVDSLDEYIQDALDLIEFANGDTSTKWGKLRADMGHEAPFGLKFLAIGNEQWGSEYVERLKPFITAIRKAHPEIKIVGSSGPNSEGAEFDYLWPEMRKLNADLVDEHFYRPADWFLSQGARYDNYDRKGPKVFAGEYACHIKKKKWNHYYPALLEAAFMTGLERNADVVHMATYAPLFAHVEGWQWRPDMIWFDNLRSVATASYYVQQLYAINKGTNVLPLTMDKKALTGADGQNGLFASAVWDADASQYIVKVANTSTDDQEITLNFAGLKKKQSIADGTAYILSSDDLDAENTLDNPNLIKPAQSAITVNGTSYTTTIAPNSFAVLRFSPAK